MTKQEEIDMLKRDLDRFLEEQKKHNSECSKVDKLIMQEKNKGVQNENKRYQKGNAS